jgi:hypothetical protein
MGGISDAQVEWAIINRLKAMLEAPPQTPFSVTQTFALFSSILLWSKNRAWVAGDRPALTPDADENDLRAHRTREELGRVLITADPWRLSLTDPQIAFLADGADEAPSGARINSDFENMPADRFFQWLRNAIAHGDGRSMRPIHKISRRTGQPLLAGFRFKCKAHHRAPRMLTLDLYHDDMRRLGIELADLFCSSLSGGDGYFEEEVGTARLQEAASAA